MSNYAQSNYKSKNNSNKYLRYKNLEDVNSLEIKPSNNPGIPENHSSYNSDFLEIKPSHNSGIPEDHMAYNSDFLEIKPTKNKY